MITVMRRYRKSLQIGLLVVIAAFVASMFVFGATGSRNGGGELRDSVATVNGEKIPIERFQRRYQSYLEAYAQIYRDRFSTEMAERLGLPQQVVGDLVQEALIVQRAGAEGLSITDEELNARIHAIPAFHENGRFALKRYQDALKRRGFTAAGFETEIRRELTRAKVESAVRSGVKVSETELEQAFRLRREEVRVAWALIELPSIVAAAGGGRAGEGFARGGQGLAEAPGAGPGGGAVGWGGRGGGVPRLEQGLLARKRGEGWAEPVRTPFGFHAIKVFELKEGGRKP